MLTLYYAANTCALATHLALEYAGASYQTVRIDMAGKQQQSPEYLRINPKGRVPALVTDRGVLTETPALLQYIAQTHPQAALAPLDDAFMLARANEFNSYLCSTVHVAHSHRGRGYRWSDDPNAVESMKKKVPQNMRDCFSLIEQSWFAGDWVLGQNLSICDLYLFTVSGWLAVSGVDVADYPKVARMRQRMLADPVVGRVLALHQPA